MLVISCSVILVLFISSFPLQMHGVCAFFSTTVFHLHLFYSRSLLLRSTVDCQSRNACVVCLFFGLPCSCTCVLDLSHALLFPLVISSVSRASRACSVFVECCMLLPLFFVLVLVLFFLVVVLAHRRCRWVLLVLISVLLLLCGSGLLLLLSLFLLL